MPQAFRHPTEGAHSQEQGPATPSHLLSEFIDGKDHFTATPAGLAYKEAPPTLFAADGTKVKEW